MIHFFLFSFTLRYNYKDIDLNVFKVVFFLQEGPRGRGRGFERNSSFTSTRGTGGRFFSPPGPYGRRESNRG